MSPSSDSTTNALQILRDSRRIAVLGIKTERQQEQPAFYVPQYLQRVGYEIVPVPVYYPTIVEILGQPVYRRVVDVTPPVDLVLVFRRSHDIPPHLDDLIAARPRAVWFQSGIRNEDAARALETAGIQVLPEP